MTTGSLSLLVWKSEAPAATSPSSLTSTVMMTPPPSAGSPTSTAMMTPPSASALVTSSEAPILSSSIWRSPEVLFTIGGKIF